MGFGGRFKDDKPGGDKPKSDQVLKFLREQQAVKGNIEVYPLATKGGKLKAVPGLEEFRNFKAGEVAYYHEEGGILRVRVLENFSDTESVGYELAVLEEIRPGPGPMPVGHVFSCDKRKKFAGLSCLWELTDTHDFSSS